jgi:hypothetical protein
VSDEEFPKLIKSILSLEPGVRYVIIIDSQGQVVSGGQREGNQNYLDPLDQQLSIKHALESWRLRIQFAEKIGQAKFALAVYEKLRRYTVPIDQNHLLYITTEPDISYHSFMEDVLNLVEIHKKNSNF